MAVVAMPQIAPKGTKTLYWWLRSGYTATQKKKPATVLIVGFSLFTWGG